MQLLTRDVGIFIVLTVKIVVQFDVANDVYLSELFATPCTSASHKAEARKMKRQLHSVGPAYATGIALGTTPGGGTGGRNTSDLVTGKSTTGGSEQ